MIPTSWKLYLDIGAFVVFCVLVGVLVHHLEGVGANRIKAEDAAALAADHAKMIEESQKLQAEADKAEVQREQNQKALTDYMVANPIGHVFVCNKSDPAKRVPSASASGSANGDTGTGSVAVPEVSAGVDIGANLDILVRAAGTLAGYYREWQGYPAYGEVGAAQQ